MSGRVVMGARWRVGHTISSLALAPWFAYRRDDLRSGRYFYTWRAAFDYAYWMARAER